MRETKCVMHSEASMTSVGDHEKKRAMKVYRPVTAAFVHICRYKVGAF